MKTTLFVEALKKQKKFIYDHLDYSRRVRRESSSLREKETN